MKNERINEIIADKIMKHHFSLFISPYATNIHEASKVMSHLKKNGFKMSLRASEKEWICEIIDLDGKKCEVYENTAERAICVAAVIGMGL